MKNALIMTCIAALAISSCMKDEVKEVNRGHAIDFRAATQTKGERVTGPGLLGNFYATALDGTDTPYFQDVVFSLTGDYFSSSPSYYWPGDGRELDFYAYHPSLEELGESAQVVLTTDTKKITGVKPDSDLLKHVDFMTAIASDKTEENSSAGIGISFKHNMAGFYVTAANELADYEYVVKGMKINNAIASGDYDLATDTWTLGSDRTDYVLDYADPVVLNKYLVDGNNVSRYELMGTYEDRYGDERSHYAFLIPQIFNDGNEDNKVTLSLNLQVNYKNADGSKTQVFPASSGNYEWVSVSFPSYYDEGEEVYEWKAGTYYEYNIQFTNPSLQLGQPVKMTMTFKSWVDGNSNTFANKELIGKWTAVDFYEVITESYYEGKTFPDDAYDVTYTHVTGEDGNTYQLVEYKQNHLEGAEEVASQSYRLGGFHYVEITDGTKMYIYIDGVRSETPFIFEDDYFLVDAFKKTDGTYFVTPHLEELDPINDDGAVRNSFITALQDDSGSYATGNYRKRVQMISYILEQIN